MGFDNGVTDILELHYGILMTEIGMDMALRQGLWVYIQPSRTWDLKFYLFLRSIGVRYLGYLALSMNSTPSLHYSTWLSSGDCECF